MRKLLLVVCFLLLTSLAFAGDSKEVLSLKRDLIVEKMARIQSELSLMRVQYKEGQDSIQFLKEELKKIQGDLEVLEKSAPPTK